MRMKLNAHCLCAAAICGLFTMSAAAQSRAASRVRDAQPAAEKAIDKAVNQAADQAADAKPVVHAYLLDTCPVSGEKLGSMGEPIVRVVGDREVKLCCKGCVPKLAAEPDKYIAKIDLAMADRQRMFYPMETCMLSGEPLTEDGEDIAIERIYQNRLVRFCCKGCAKDFNDDPAAYLKKLDEAVIAQQSEHYPLTTCAVAETSELGKMGDPIEVVYANRLVKFCCPDCQPKFEADPAPFIARLDKAWMAMHKDTHGEADEAPSGEAEEAGGHGDHDHGDHDG